MHDDLYYFTGKPCKHGHVSVRYTQNRTCVACAKSMMTEWRKKNQDQYLRKQRLRQREQNSVRQIRNAIRRDILRSAEGCYMGENIQALLRAQQGICAAPHCGEKIEHSYHVDHIEAVVNGGTSWPDNLQLLCPACNCSKGAKNYQVWCEEKISA